jgi:hypothetical protein
VSDIYGRDYFERRQFVGRYIIFADGTLEVFQKKPFLAADRRVRNLAFAEHPVEGAFGDAQKIGGLHHIQIFQFFEYGAPAFLQLSQLIFHFAHLHDEGVEPRRVNGHFFV